MQEDPVFAENFRRKRREDAARAAARKKDKAMSMGIMILKLKLIV
jgi:hypothetical protein